MWPCDGVAAKRLYLRCTLAGYPGTFLFSGFLPYSSFPSMALPYRRRKGLNAWLNLPLTLLKIRSERPRDAAEEVRYLESRQSSYVSSRPMQIILAALRERATAPDSATRSELKELKELSY